jgi:hypothetical protein
LDGLAQLGKKIDSGPDTPQALPSEPQGRNCPKDGECDKQEKKDEEKCKKLPWQNDEQRACYAATAIKAAACRAAKSSVRNLNLEGRKLTTDRLGMLIAERELDLASEDGKSASKVLVKIGKPRKIPGQSIYRCHFQIIGVGSEKVRYGEGSDDMQALILALTKIGSHLYTSKESVSKRLSCMGMLNLGFPAFITEYPSDLVPEPAHKLLL